VRPAAAGSNWRHRPRPPLAANWTAPSRVGLGERFGWLRRPSSQFRKLPSDGTNVQAHCGRIPPAPGGWPMGLDGDYGLRQPRGVFLRSLPLAPGGDRVLRVLHHQQDRSTCRSGPSIPKWVELFELRNWLESRRSLAGGCRTDLHAPPSRQGWAPELASSSAARPAIHPQLPSPRRAWGRHDHIGLPDTVAAGWMRSLRDDSHPHLTTTGYRRDQQQAVDAALARRRDGLSRQSATAHSPFDFPWLTPQFAVAGPRSPGPPELRPGWGMAPERMPEGSGGRWSAARRCTAAQWGSAILSRGFCAGVHRRWQRARQRQPWSGGAHPRPWRAGADSSVHSRAAGSRRGQSPGRSSARPCVWQVAGGRLHLGNPEPGDRDRQLVQEGLGSSRFAPSGDGQRQGWWCSMKFNVALKLGYLEALIGCLEGLDRRPELSPMWHLTGRGARRPCCRACRPGHRRCRLVRQNPFARRGSKRRSVIEY